MFFSGGPSVGLDIGSKKIKLIKVRRRGDRIEPVIFGSRETPPGTVDAGIIVDTGELTAALAEMVSDLKLKGARVVAAVSGQQVYIRTLVMPDMKEQELRAAAEYQALNFLPIPVQEAVIDVSPLRRFQDEEGKKVEVFFVAARKLQVDNLRTVCADSGLRLVAVDIEPLALDRLYRGADSENRAILNIGASRTYIAIFESGVLVSLRHLSFGCAAFFQGLNPYAGQGPVELEQIDLIENDAYSYLMADIVSEISRTMEYYTLQNDGRRIEKIIICGGGSRIRGLAEFLSSSLGCEVQMGDIEPRVIVPHDLTDHQRREFVHDYPVALGLAARGVL